MSPSVDVEYGAQMEREAQRYKAQRDEAIRRAEQRIAELEAENERLEVEKATAVGEQDMWLERAERAEQLCEQLVEAKNLIEQRKVEAEQENERLREAWAVLRDVEWAGDDDHQAYCVVCDGNRPNHTDTCRLAAILKETP